MESNSNSLRFRLLINRSEYPDLATDLKAHEHDIHSRAKYLMRKGLEAITGGLTKPLADEPLTSATPSPNNDRGDATMEQLGLNVADFMIVRGDKQS